MNSSWDQPNLQYISNDPNFYSIRGHQQQIRSYILTGVGMHKPTQHEYRLPVVCGVGAGPHSWVPSPLDTYILMYPAP